MLNNKQSLNCERLISGIDFELDKIEVCCNRCHKGGGNIELAEVSNGEIDFEILEKNRNELINNLSPKCDGCFNLETKEWNIDKRIKYIHFNHWTHCNTDCIYCYTKEEKYKGGAKHYNALPILKQLIEKYGFSPDGEVTFAGGEPCMLDEFDEILEYLIQIGAKKIVVHSSGVIYSKALENALKKGSASLVISHDSGSEETYKKIKNTDFCGKVWENTNQYSQSGVVISKYIIIPNLNDSKSEINNWLKKVSVSGIKSVIIDIEHKYFEQNKNNKKIIHKLLELCEYIRIEAEKKGIDTELYNTAKYIYSEQPIYSTYLKYKRYVIGLLALAMPILLGSIGHSIIGATDVVVVARYNITSLAAISIANAILFTLFIFGLGIQDAICIILSNKRGAKEGIKKYLNSVLLFSLLLGIIFALICYSTSYLIDYLSFEPKIIPYIKQYIHIVSFSMFGIFLYQGIKQFLQSYEIVNFPNIVILVSALINILLDIILVFGLKDIIPAMGVKGAALATLIVRTFMAVVMLVYVYKYINIKDKIEFGFIKDVVKIGHPIGIALLIEFLAFHIVTVLVGRESSICAAVHNILITISSITFNVPLAIAIAVAVKVSYNYGAKKFKEIKEYSYTGTVMSILFMSVCSILLAVFPKQIVGFFTENEDVMQIALPIVLIAAMYQVFDGFQVVAGGVLRGLKMTKAASWCVFSGYWIIGMPIAYILVYKYGMSLKGYWIAFAFALSMMGILEAIIAKYKFRKIKVINKFS